MRTLSAVLLVGAAAVTSGVTPTAVAQDDDDDVIVVTGSRLRAIEAQGPSPVVTITAEDMDSRGYNTVLEALNDLPQNAGGGLDQQFTFGFTPSASAVDLRGFGVGRSLVLVDGRRLPVFPLAASGVDNFVDLSSIPAAAIERIEVLTDGASAIYGSDAVSGVVNVILKKSAETELSLRRSDTTEGGGGQDRVQFAAGIEGTDGASALFFMEYFNQEVLEFSDRDYSRSDVLGGIGGPGPGIFSSFGDRGTFFDDNGTPDNPSDNNITPAPFCSTSGGSPGVVGPVCRFNRAQYRQLVPEIEHFSLTGKLTKPVTDQIDFFATTTYFTSNVKTQIEPVPGDTTTVPASNPNNPTGFDGFFVRRMVEFEPRTGDIDNDTYRVLAGFNGTFGRDYAWEAGVHYAEQRVTSRRSGFMSASGLDRAVTVGVVDLDNDGDLDPISLFDPIPQAVIDAIRLEPRTDGISTISSVDFQLTGDGFAMRHGPAQFAVVTEYAKQRFEDRRSADILSGDVEGLGGSSGGGDRKYAALGVELGIPLLSNLELNLAGRYDDYDDASDVGGAFSPRVALQYRPTPNLLLRLSAGESFRAPDMQRLFGAETTGFLELIDTPQCIAEGGTGRGDPNPATPSCTEAVQSVEVRTGSNLNLVEETGENLNFGLVWEPISRLLVSADFWYVKLEQIVNEPSEQFILDSNAKDGSFADAITRNTITTGCDVSRNPGCLFSISSQSRNLSFQRARGVDSRIQYTLPTRTRGTFDFVARGSYTDLLEIKEFRSEPVVNVLRDGELGEFVRLKGYASTGWTFGPWAATVYLNYIGPFTPDDPTTFKEVGSYTTVNISATYALPWRSRVQVGVNNVFNEDPPFDLSDGNSSQPFYNQFFHDPYGSTWWVNYRQNF